MKRLDRVSIQRVLAWVDAAAGRLEAEDAALETAAGRVLAADAHAPDPIPADDCAAIDGYAVRAEESLGAGAYNPLGLAAIVVEAGEKLPCGSDAVVPFDQAEVDGAGRVVLIEPAAAGANVDRRGAITAAGAVLVRAGTCLMARHLGVLAAAGHVELSVTRRPRVRLATAARARSGSPVDGNGPMLRALIARDAGVVVEPSSAGAFAAGADVILVAGGTGAGRDDRSAADLAACGALDLYGVALAPGETAGFGHTADATPVILLPGAPAACLWNYELFAGRAIRRLGGRDPALPYPSITAETARKIVSSIGVTEICPIRRLPDGRIEPAGSFAEAGLMAAVDADGFVVIPEASEGYPAGALATAYLYDKRPMRGEPPSWEPTS